MTRFAFVRSFFGRSLFVCSLFVRSLFVVVAATICLVGIVLACATPRGAWATDTLEEDGAQAEVTQVGTAQAEVTQADAIQADTAQGVARPSTSGALAVEGTQLVDQNGDAIQLKGISTHGIAWFGEYVNEACFEDLATFFGANVVRLAMYTAESGGYCTDGDPAALRALIEAGVEYASAADMYVIIDWHILADGDPNTNKDAAKEFFEWASDTYASYDNVLYEICNEPNGGTTWASVKSYAEEIIEIIRANDPEAVILIGTPTWSQDVNEAAADPVEGYDNLMYVLHFYAATHTDDLRQRMADAVEAGLPVFVSEYGICDASGTGAIDVAQADAWVELMNRLGISYVCWNLSNKDESSAILETGCTKTSGFDYADLSACGQWLYGMLNANSDTAPDDATPDDATPDDATPDDGTSAASTADVAASGTSDNISWSAQLTGSWESDGHTVYMYSFTVTNIGSNTTTSWSVSVPLGGAITVTDSWNGTFVTSDTTLTITNVGYNGELSPGASTSDIGVILYGAPLELS